jgi:F-type H+-transporting ATPase subunit c
LFKKSRKQSFICKIISLIVTIINKNMDVINNVEAARLIAKGMTMTIAMAGSAIGEGYIIGKALEAMGRNPEVSGSIFSKMIIGVALAESTAIYAFVAFFLL